MRWQWPANANMAGQMVRGVSPRSPPGPDKCPSLGTQNTDYLPVTEQSQGVQRIRKLLESFPGNLQSLVSPKRGEFLCLILKVCEVEFV